MSAAADIAPSWRGVLATLLLMLEAGSPEGKRVAQDELCRMARTADLAAGRFTGADTALTPLRLLERVRAEQGRPRGA